MESNTNQNVTGGGATEVAGTAGATNQGDLAGQSVPTTSSATNVAEQSAPATGGQSLASELEKELETTPAVDTGPEPEPAPVKGKKKNGSGLIIAMVFVILLAAGGIGFGVWAMMDGNQQKEELNSQISSLKKQNSELMEKIDNSTDTMDDVTDKTVDTKEYIYVGEWGVKIRIPEGLSYVGYKYGNEIDDGNNQYSSDYSTIGVIAVPAGTNKTNAKEFYRLAENGQYSPCYLASVARMSKNETEVHGSIIFSDESYNYVFFRGQVSCTDADTDREISEIESSARGLVWDMLSNKENYSAI